jgi:4-aminobutyrate aminotransferase / (S)-3-amino-2-methylpropionate transaminase / 5-aminovalerate transaminase
VVPPDGFLQGLRRLCDERGLLLVFDEIYTGFGRTGRWFAGEHWGVVPDLMTVGKGLTGGFPFAACIGTDRVMESWPRSSGEAIHTSTFLGHPVGCAAALACMRVLREEGLVQRAAETGAWMIGRLREIAADHPRVGEVRGLGMMIGVELVRDRSTREPAPELAGRLTVESLRRGILLLGGGSYGNVLSLSPPFMITREQAAAALQVIADILDDFR